MILTDTHTHLYYEEDPILRAELIQRSVENGVNRLFLPNVDLDSVEKIKQLVSEHPDLCFPMMGLHPCSVTEDVEGTLDAIYEELNRGHYLAIGEIGIDLYWDKSTLALQQMAFRRQIAWAKDRNLPIVIHCREAFDEVYEILCQEQDDKLRGIFHCFTGTVEQAHKVIDLGFYLGIGGVLTYKNAGLDKVLEQVSLEHIVLETDAPYLTPVPFRGKKPNESSFLVYVAGKLAEVKGITMDELAMQTTENSKRIFGI